MNSKVIIIDGKTYHSIEEMPGDIREKYEQAIRALGDANNNQIPDAFETMNIFADKDKDGAPDILENLVAGHAAENSMKIVIDGKEFDGLENLPPETRARYEEVMAGLDSNRNGIPDFVEGMMNTASQAAKPSIDVGIEASRRSPALPANPTITPDTSNGSMLVLAGLFLFVLCLAGAASVWYFFLR